jgi:hypothetical protein
VVELISEFTGFKGRLVWDTTKVRQPTTTLPEYDSCGTGVRSPGPNRFSVGPEANDRLVSAAACSGKILPVQSSEKGSVITRRGL